MAGKTLIGGTAYTITGGKTKIDGTAYSIKKGKTKIGGTAYDINFIQPPTFAELFAAAAAYSSNYRAAGSSGTLTISKPSSATAGQVWYAFFAVNGTLEVSRLDILTSTTMQKTEQLLNMKTSGTSGTSYTLTLSADGTQLSCSGIYAGTVVLIRFNTYSASIIDYMFKNCTVTSLAKYYGTSAGSQSTGMRLLTTNIPTSGVMFSLFRDIANSTTAWGAISPSTPTSTIEGGKGSSWTNGSALLRYVSASDPYYLPTTGGSSNTTVYSYLLASLKETW